MAAVNSASRVDGLSAPQMTCNVHRVVAQVRVLCISCTAQPTVAQPSVASCTRMHSPEPRPARRSISSSLVRQASEARPVDKSQRALEEQPRLGQRTRSTIPLIQMPMSRNKCLEPPAVPHGPHAQLAHVHPPGYQRTRSSMAPERPRVTVAAGRLVLRIRPSSRFRPHVTMLCRTSPGGCSALYRTACRVSAVASKHRRTESRSWLRAGCSDPSPVAQQASRHESRFGPTLHAGQQR
ncbi:hypothetical protein RJ55_06772 [Drechmeria coniospora]|nr:hypothetical protein RJ55_06772 [Drechmeria coniospora]